MCSKCPRLCLESLYLTGNLWHFSLKCENVGDVLEALDDARKCQQWCYGIEYVLEMSDTAWLYSEQLGYGKTVSDVLVYCRMSVKCKGNRVQRRYKAEELDGSWYVGMHDSGGGPLMYLSLEVLELPRSISWLSSVSGYWRSHIGESGGVRLLGSSVDRHQLTALLTAGDRGDDPPKISLSNVSWSADPRMSVSFGSMFSLLSSWSSFR